VNLVMQPGRKAEAGKGQVDSLTVKGDVTTSVSELPLNGRSASDVAALEPGWQPRALRLRVRLSEDFGRK
jgi:hypothetical protein